MAITHNRVTGLLTLFILDQIRDEDHQLDEVNLTGTVTWTPVLPKGLSQAKATGPNRLVSLKPIKSLVADGQIVSLSGTVSEIGDVPGEVGQELPVMIDDTPVWWRASFDVKFESTVVTIPTMLVDATEGDVDITTLVSAGGFPEVPTGDIESVIATVRSMSRAAEDAIRRAEAAADAVGEVDAAAREAVRVAGESASAAESSAAASEASAVRAEAGADRATTEADRATEQASAASSSANAAESSATVAENHATVAGSVATQAAQAAVAEVVDGAPEALDTLRELAEKATDNSDQIATLLTMVGSKAEKSSFQTVTASPSSPTPGVFYFVVEA